MKWTDKFKQKGFSLFHKLFINRTFTIAVISFTIGVFIALFCLEIVLLIVGFFLGIMFDRIALKIDEYMNEKKKSKNKNDEKIGRD